MVTASQNESAESGANWSSKWAFIMAAVGSAVGLGNLWRFPAEAGTSGGGAFVIFYIFCVLLIGVPVLLSETLIGRLGKTAAVQSVENVAKMSHKPTQWSILASIGMLGAFLILTYYSVIAGWVLYYVGVFIQDIGTAISSDTMLTGAFQGNEAADSGSLLKDLTHNSPLMIGLHALFMGVTTFVVSRGVDGGIEKAAVYLMPIFFILFLAITVYSAMTGAFAEAVDFLFAFKTERLTNPNVMLSALGQALFSLSLGSAMMITYGAYSNRSTNLAITSVQIAGADTFVAVVAGLAIFPIVFAAGLAVNSGPTLMFITLPTAFETMPFGSLVGMLFFIMVFFAALTSSVALLEAPVSYCIAKFGVKRHVISWLLGVIAFFIGIFSALSQDPNMLGGWVPMDFGIFQGQGFLDMIDSITGKILLPISALMVAIFTGWIADKRLVNAETGLSGGMLAAWRFLIAWVCPLVIGVILITGLFPGLTS